MPALDIDTTIIHAQQADRAGNVQLWGIIGIQKEAVLAARRSLVTVEEIVDELEPRPGAMVLPSWAVTAVAEVPARSTPVLRARLLRPRQRLLPGVGRDQPRPRLVRVVAGGRPMSVTADEMMIVTASRSLRDGDVCFVGIGQPSTAANLARRTHAPELVLIYESGTLGAKPDRLPLSIGDGVLAEHADAVIGIPEVFNYWLQAGRVDVGFLGGAQLDKYANINTTVIGSDYADPKVRLPGAGGAPEIAASCKEVVIIMRQSLRSFVERVDFVTSMGFGDGPGHRERLGLRGNGPGQGDHRSRRARTRSGHLRTDPRRDPSGRVRRRGAGSDRLGPCRQRRPDDDRPPVRGGTADPARPASNAGSETMTDSYVLDAIRTPIGKFGGGLAGVRPDDLAAHVVRVAGRPCT